MASMAWRRMASMANARASVSEDTEEGARTLGCHGGVRAVSCGTGVIGPRAGAKAPKGSEEGRGERGRGGRGANSAEELRRSCLVDHRWMGTGRAGQRDDGG